MNFEIKGALSRARQFLGTERPLKMMKNGFISPQSSFHSQDIKIFALTFWSRIGQESKKLRKLYAQNTYLNPGFNFES